MFKSPDRINCPDDLTYGAVAGVEASDAMGQTVYPGTLMFRHSHRYSGQQHPTDLHLASLHIQNGIGATLILVTRLGA
jgi:hypothetical protein